MVIKPDGPQIIDKMIGKFQGIVDGLDKGVTMCSAKQEQNVKIIDSLTAQKQFLIEKTEQAVTFRDNLRKMLTKNLNIKSQKYSKRRIMRGHSS